MFTFFYNKFSLIFLMISICFTASAQNLSLEINKEKSAHNSQLIDLVAKIKNNDNQSFSGFLQIKTPDGFKSISGKQIAVELAANEQIFIPIKILSEQTAKAGNTSFEIKIIDQNNQILQSQTINHQVETNNNLNLTTQKPIVFVNNPNDSLSISVTVSNLGNLQQEVAVVFSVPGLMSEKNFFEQTGVIKTQQDSVFTFSFLPPQAMLDHPQFIVNVTGMRGSEKELFGNLSITVQNIASNRRYQDLNAVRQSQYFQRNRITASYRKMGNNNEAYQLIGAGDINLPAGYLALSGNIYQANNSNDPIVSNTYAHYHLYQNDLKIGNINRFSEIPLFGRGIEVGIGNKNNDQRLEVGFVDQNFNLVEQNAFLQNGYGIYATGKLNSAQSPNYAAINYVFKDDALERAQHHMTGVEKTHVWNNDWRGTIKAHTAWSEYLATNKNEPSMAIEAQYSGRINKIRLHGNYFYSSAYFPGNRRGMKQMHQSVLGSISQSKTFYAHAFLADFAPKSHTYDLRINSTNFRFDTGINFVHSERFTVKMGYQFQTESSNSYGEIEQGNTGDIRMNSHRMVTDFNFISKNNQHSALITLEEGFSKASTDKKIKPQYKISASYRHRWFNLNSTYQYGSFFLSEHVITYRKTQGDGTFRRLTSTLSADQRFWQDKAIVSAGLSYIKDYNVGQTPSAFLNLTYNPNSRFRIFLNSSWYRYDVSQNLYGVFAASRDVLMVETGVSVNLKGNKPNTGKKGKVTAFVFYDQNNNNVFDKDEKVAGDYLVTFNNNTFKTNKDGTFTYRALPFGKYSLKPSAQKGWFTDGGDFMVNEYDTNISIPLHQNGTAMGKITYEFDSKTVVDFEPKVAGIVFNVTQNGKFVQRIATNDDGEFLLFLPTGEYQLTLNENSLAVNTYCEKNSQNITVQAGNITKLEKFVIKVKQKQINIKRFGS